MSTYDVYGIGNALVDYEFATSDQKLQEMSVDKGLMTLVDQDRQTQLLEMLHQEIPQRACGGSAANTMIAVSQLGGKAFYSCKVAKDETGDFYAKDLQKNKVDSSLFSVEREEGITGKCLVMITPDAERSMNTFLGITETLSEKNLVESALKQSKYMYMEGYVVTSPTGRAAAIQARKWAEENNVKTAITFSDPNMVEFFKEGLMEMIGSGVDLIFCNEAEALKYTGANNVEAAKAELLKVSKSFVVTMGAKGAFVCENGNSFMVEGFPCTPKDSNGAGDIFAGSFLYGISHGLSFEKSARLANYAASLLVQKFGPRLDEEGIQKLNEFAKTL